MFFERVFPGFNQGSIIFFVFWAFYKIAYNKLSTYIAVYHGSVLWLDGPLMPMRFVVFEYCEKSDVFNYLVTGPMEKQQMYVCMVTWCNVHNKHINTITLVEPAL